MSGLFSLNSILTENNTFKSIIKTPVDETYLNSVLPILKKFNTGITESTMTMYKGISEATSRSEENEKFAEYFKKYKTLVNDYIREMNELVSKFAINVNTYIDANQSTIDNADGMSVAGEPTIKVYDYQNLNNDMIPNMDIEKAFKKEFKFIGKMMQDLGSAITDDETKANVLATVCNNLSNEIQDGWLEKCMIKIANLDDTQDFKDTNFSSVLYKKFIPEDLKDMNITAGDIQEARLALLNASALVDGIEKANDEFAAGLERVSEEIGAMFFRNQDGIMPIKTDEEGVADRDYKLKPSSFNQFNIFMANKCTQITELCNLYLVAIGIKADMIYKYLKQCIDIIETAMNGVDCTPNDDDMSENNDIADNGDSQDTDESSDDIDGDETPDMDDNSSILGDDYDGSSDNNMDAPDINPEEANASESEFDEASYLFDANIFELERAYEQYELKRATAGYIGEATGDGGFGDKIRSLISKIIESLQKFFDFNSKSIAKYVNNLKDQKYVTALKNAKIPDGMTIDWIDTTKIESLKSSESENFTSDLLDDKFKYIKDTWKDYLDQNAALKSITDDILNTITTKGTTYTDKERENSINFLLNYDTICGNTKSDIEKLKGNSERDIKAVENGTLSLGEAVSTFEQALAMYFMEADGDANKQVPATQTQNPSQNQDTKSTNNQSNSTQTKPDDNKDADKGSSESFGNDGGKNGSDKAKTRVSNYYTANIQILSAKLNICKKAAVKYISFLTHILAPKNVDNNDNQQQDNNAQNK